MGVRSAERAETVAKYSLRGFRGLLTLFGVDVELVCESGTVCPDPRHQGADTAEQERCQGAEVSHEMK
jgi:hypothetical protein